MGSKDYRRQNLSLSSAGSVSAWRQTRKAQLWAMGLGSSALPRSTKQA